MAEARSHAALSALGSSGLNAFSDEKGYHLRVNLTIPSFKAVQKGTTRFLVQTVREVKNFFFPVGAPLCVGTVTVLVPLVLSRPSDSWLRSGFIAHHAWNIGRKYIPYFARMPLKMQVGSLAMAIGVLGMGGFAFINRFFLRAVLSYRGYMFERKPSLKTKIFFAWMKWQQFLNGKRGPALYSWQMSIPSLPVPALKKTTSQYLKSVEPLLTDDEFAEVKQMADEFLKHEGYRLQRWLIAKSFIAANYVTDWWEKYVYLLGRDPIMINSNYYIMDAGGPPVSNVQTSRAACVVGFSLDFKRRLDSDDPFKELAYPPWFCMFQYERIFSTTRIPGRDCDVLKHWDEDESRHIAVLRKGMWYALPVYHADNSVLERCEIEQQLDLIVANADGVDAGRFGSKPTKAESLISSLTAGDRSHWANARDIYFKDGNNKQSLSIIESAIFVLVLEHEQPQNPDEYGHSLIHGSTANRWFDKSFTVVVYPDGYMGMNCEHSWADAPVMGHLMEYAVMSNYGENCLADQDKTGRHKACGKITGCRIRAYDANGRCVKTGPPALGIERKLPPFYKLAWDLTEEAELAIFEANMKAIALASDLDIRVREYAKYGKGFVKDQNMGPDGYVQMALQLAYYRTHGKLVLTYESTMTRMFRNGRTETVRPCTNDSKNFVLAFESEEVAKSEKISLLRKAVKTHVDNTRLCMSGSGIDRHLFALYVVSKGTNTDSKFLKYALSKPWTLSTSQQPQNQTDLWDPKKQPWRISMGGGFGPVTDSGYGCSYQVLEEKLFFHITSKISSPDSDSTKFIGNLFAALDDLQILFSK